MEDRQQQQLLWKRGGGGGGERVIFCCVREREIIRGPIIWRGQTTVALEVRTSADGRRFHVDIISGRVLSSVYLAITNGGKKTRRKRH